MKLKTTIFEIVSNNTENFLQDIVARYGKKNTPKLPFLYATTKMHKTLKFRYITAGRVFSDQSVAVDKCLNLLMKTANTSFDYRIKELDNDDFVINSPDKLIEFLNKSNDTNDKKQITTWDFSTKIPLDKLIEKVFVFVRKVYAGVRNSKQSEFITCSDNSNTANFSKSTSKKTDSFSCDVLIENINSIINNSYIVYHDMVYCQKIGIPMGTNCAPFFG